jgi:hypothetical protein
LEVAVKLRAFLIAAGLMAAAGSANAVFFFFLPIGAIQNAVQGGHCVPATAKAGDRINIGGKSWVVKETNGVSSRCSQYPNWPVIAKLEPYVSEAELASEFQACLPMGATEGMTTTVVGVGEVYVRSVNANDCTDMRNPVSAQVVRVKYAKPMASPTESAREPQPATAVGSEQRQAPHPVAAPTPILETPKMLPAVTTQQPVKEQRSIAERLRELKQLRDENLITDAVYEAKQREILSGQ